MGNNKTHKETKTGYQNLSRSQKDIIRWFKKKEALIDRQIDAYKQKQVDINRQIKRLEQIKTRIIAESRQLINTFDMLEKVSAKNDNWVPKQTRKRRTHKIKESRVKLRKLYLNMQRKQILDFFGRPPLLMGLYIWMNHVDIKYTAALIRLWINKRIISPTYFNRHKQTFRDGKTNVLGMLKTIPEENITWKSTNKNNELEVEVLFKAISKYEGDQKAWQEIKATASLLKEIISQHPRATRRYDNILDDIERVKNKFTKN